MTNWKTLLPMLAAAGLLTVAPAAYGQEVAPEEPCKVGATAACETEEPEEPEVPETETQTVLGGDREVEVADEEEEEEEEEEENSGFGAGEPAAEEEHGSDNDIR